LKKCNNSKRKNHTTWVRDEPSVFRR
jgi:hypothetical protein